MPRQVRPDIINAQQSASPRAEGENSYGKSPTMRARRSRISNYSQSNYGREKPLPFNAVRYIGLMLKQMKDGQIIHEEKEDSIKSFQND